MFVDTHCHLFREYYENMDEIIKNSLVNKVGYYINNGCDKKSNLEVISLTKEYENMYGAIGIHPENVDCYEEEDLLEIKENIRNDKIVAIGEIGLDYHYTKENKDEQIKLFARQLQIAEDNDLPVIIHSRDATLDTINTLKKYKVRGVIHSFSGSLETALVYIKMGFLLGVNGVVTFKNAKLKDVIKEVGLENIVLETDSPYLTPEPFRGKQNFPGHVLEVANFVANLYGLSAEKVKEITNENVKKIFGKMTIKI